MRVGSLIWLAMEWELGVQRMPWLAGEQCQKKDYVITLLVKCFAVAQLGGPYIYIETRSCLREFYELDGHECHTRRCKLEGQ
jgi:hypothetical protein